MLIEVVIQVNTEGTELTFEDIKRHFELFYDTGAYAICHEDHDEYPAFAVTTQEVNA